MTPRHFARPLAMSKPPTMLPAPTGIQQLPHELLTILLEMMCGDSGPSSILLPRLRPGLDVASFSQVSKLFWSVAYNSPRLWTKYSVDFSSGGTARQFNSLLRTLDNFIAHACGLDVDFIITQPSPEFPQVIFLDILRTHASRIRSLELVISYESAVAFGRTRPIPFGRLQNLSVRMLPSTADIDDPVLNGTSHVLNLTPVLTVLEMGYCVWQPDKLSQLQLEFWNLPLYQLSKFHAPNVDLPMSECIRVMTNSLQLVECTLSCDEWPAPDELAPARPWILQRMRILHLIFRMMHGMFWAYITTPNLTTLRITSLSDRDAGGWDQERFMAFKHRSECILSHFALQFDFTSLIDEVIEILETSPELEDLELRWTQRYFPPETSISQLLERLSGHRGRPLWLPHLRTVRLDATEDSLQMLSSRCDPNTGYLSGETKLRDIVLYAEEAFDPLTLVLRATGARVALEPMDFYGAHNLRAMDGSDGDADDDNDGEGEEMEDDGGEGSEKEGELNMNE
ncbi:hypothetical protein FB451DRAFT_1485270 [Mycena latifolia]|nr:hypothetical protein FB451DRAFT_1485270 [Mycena latifolia]